MSRFFAEKYQALAPYVPGEQPGNDKYIKLNTNENPYPPVPEAAEAVREESRRLYLYSRTDPLDLRTHMAERLNISADEVVMTNGSDEVLNFAFMAFCDRNTPAVFADITYGFYPVFAAINLVPYEIVPLRDDFTINISDYFHRTGTIFIANPNAPTSIALKRSEIEEILKQNPDHVVVVDEAYVDFGAESSVPLIRQYDNLLITQTFSKSRSMAGARLGMGIGNPDLIRDLNAVRNSTNPYNVNSLTEAAGIACLANDEYNKRNCRIIMDTREQYGQKLREIGFEMPESRTNFFFARHPAISGKDLYLELKKRGILIRHFDKERIRDYNRITVGTPEQMEKVVETIKSILEERR